MSGDKVPWFVADRSEALAGLLLTSRKDVHVQTEKRTDDGVDFLLAVDEGEPLPTRLFVVQVRGTTSSDREEWMKGVKELFRSNGSSMYLPACVFVVNVRDNRAQYAWVAEPLVEAQGAKLRFHQTGEFRELDPSAVDGIVDRVKVWYDILPRQLVPSPT